MNTLSMRRPALPRHTPSLPTPARRGAFGKVLLNEARLTWRLPVGMIGGVGIPMVLLVIFGSLPKFHTTMPGLGGLTLFDLYMPVIMVLGLAALALWGLPGPLVSYREQGILRRLSTTPVPPSWLLAAQATVQTCIAVAGLALVVGTSMVAFGSPAPKSPAGLVLSCALAIAGLFPMGLLIASVARTPNAASVIGRLAFFPLMFFAGLWLPRALMPAVLLNVSNYTPLGAAVQAIQDSVLSGFPPAAPLLVLAAYALILGFVARRCFRWE